MDLESKTKDEVFEELVEALAETYPEFDHQEMVDALISRENRMNTAILPGIAMPHGYCPAIDGTIGAVGFSRTGINYNCSDPVHVVFLLLMNGSRPEDHLRVLGRLLELLNSESFAVIQAAKTSREVYEVLRRF
jgi:mannitol/fructose-specific phosphotransferase system IIA component (Ntr-type)